jgi:hypothetical protein
MTAGHRITLTYNLYVHRGLGGIAGCSETLDAMQLPVFKEAKEALAKSDFMLEGELKSVLCCATYLHFIGGFLGKYCSNTYAHAIDNAASAMPSIFKGSDMVTYEAFRSAGVEVIVRPVVEHISNRVNTIEIKNNIRTHSHVDNEFTEFPSAGYKWGDHWSLEEVYDQFPNTLMKVTWMNEPTIGTENL